MLSEPTVADRVGPSPLYTQVREALRAQILDGSLRAHDRLPSESALTARFAVSRVTVRQALNDLSKEGLIFKIAGKGSFVSKPRPVQNLARLQGLGEAMSHLGYETTNQLLGLRTLAASPEISAQLRCGLGDSVTEIGRLRCLDREPVSLERTYVLADLGNRLAGEDLVTRDLYHIIENDYGIPLGHADLSIEALAASPEHARLLRVPADAPVLHLKRLTCSAKGAPVEFSYVFYRGDSFSYRVRVERV